MRLLFIIYSFIDNTNGISKKIQAQVSALRAAGIEVDLCHQQLIDGNRYWAVNGSPIAKIGSGVRALLKHYLYFGPIKSYVKHHSVDCVYLRYVHNATPLMLRFFDFLKKRGIRLIMEIPTFPYDGEYVGAKGISRIIRKIERFSRNKFSAYCHRIVTFSADTEIFGVPTVRLSNAVDITNIPLRDEIVPHRGVKLLGVANINFWHGFDRLISGLGAYYRTPHSTEVSFTIVGGGSYIAPLRELAKKENVAEHVVFRGRLGGVDLDKEFEDADLCVGCLACHRKNITEVKSLKNVEYASRGIPFVYSELNDDFDSMPYVIKVPPSEEPVNIDYLLDALKRMDVSPSDIRKSVANLTWTEQMKKVASALMD